MALLSELALTKAAIGKWLKNNECQTDCTGGGGIAFGRR